MPINEANTKPTYGTGFQAAKNKADNKAFTNWYRANNRAHTTS
ncbi:MAG: hypothetical protein ABJI96_00705 [Paracoccaceae bacterium]